MTHKTKVERINFMPLHEFDLNLVIQAHQTKYKKNGKDFIFGDISTDAITKRLQRFKVKYHLEKIQNHDYRKTKILELMVDEGIPAVKVQEFIGHANVSSTFVYAKETEAVSGYWKKKVITEQRKSLGYEDEKKEESGEGI